MDKIINERYELIKVIGTGGMADVFLANDLILGRKIALKMIRIDLANDPISLLRFKREAKAISKMDHQNIVQVYDVGEHDHRPYIVMEYVPGVTLKQLLQKRIALPIEEVVDIMKQLTSAIIHAHDNNIVHRDIKPHNVLIKDDGTAKITDFGIAISSDHMQITANDTVLGSAHYLAPEITNGEEASKYSDIYALGIVFYELLVGEVPFKGKTPVAIAMAHINEPFPKIQSKNSSLPIQMQNIIEKACAKDVKERYQSCQQMYDEICNWKMQEPPKVMPLRKAMTFKQQWIMIGSVVLLVCYCVFLVMVNREKVAIDKVMIPNVLGKSIEKAKEILMQNGLNVTVDTNQIESDTYMGGLVAQVYPAVNTIIKKDEPVRLSISKGRVITLPSFEGENVKVMYQYLIDNKIKMQIEEKLVGSNEKSGTILKQSIAPNVLTRLDKDSKLVVEVAVSGDAIVMPYLIGKKLDEAEKILVEMGFEVEIKGINFVVSQSQQPFSVIKKEEVKKIILIGES